MNIKTDDVVWNYAATFLKVSSSALLLPLILRMMPPEKVGMYIVFITISSLTLLLDFGFNSSFTRNITYVFSGVNTLKVKGFDTSISKKNYVDYSLLKGLIYVMKQFYLIISLFSFALLISLGSYYINYLLEDYQGDLNEIYIAWSILIIINTYNIYNYYLGALLIGKGLIKKSKQITMIGQILFLVIASFLIISGYGLIAIFTAQGFSYIIIRVLSKKYFFDNQLTKKLKLASNYPKNKIFNSIYPNSIKIGITSLGAFLVHRSSIIIGSLYVSLENIASYGITIQLMTVVSSIAGTYVNTFLPKINELRIKDKIAEIKSIYLKGHFYFTIIFFFGSIFVLFMGDWALNLIKSSTLLIPKSLLVCLIIFSFLENNHSIAGHILLTKNEVPFFKASIFSGFVVVLLLFIFFQFTDLGIFSLILAPGIAQGIYQNWKWPYEVYKELKINKSDFLNYISTFSTLKKWN